MNHNNKNIKVIAWELTRRCNLSCKHCRGAALNQCYENEFSTEECFKTIDNISAFAKPILIMTGGEPMMRPDIFEIATYATKKGLKPVMAPCGHLISPETAKQMKDSGVMAISISLDGATADSHDAFRGIPGAYEKTMKGLQHAIDAGIPFQINTTVSKHNVDELPQILDKTIELGAKTFDLFFLVPTGRGFDLIDQEISAEKQEEVLRWVWEQSQTAPIRVKTTCSPHYARIQKLKRVTQPTSGGCPHGHGHSDPNYVSGGCMAGKGFVFISHRGVLQTCGFLDISCGDLRQADYDFKTLYETSEVFTNLRDTNNYLGKCGQCEFRNACGGCRARAYGHTGKYLAEEPGCSYIPRKLRESS